MSPGAVTTQMNKRLRIRLLTFGCLFFLTAAGFLVWHCWARPTRIAFANYPEYILAPMLDQEIAPAIEITPLPWTEKSGPELKNFDFV